jgi:2-polyprenyl-6-methoxyphenol hydroxylase-like FAD-dependent oxidoreductase
MSREQYQRCSQTIFEVWLKPKIQAEPLIDSHFGMKFESFDEGDDSMTSTLTDVASGKTHIVKSAYVIACDGAGSKVRRALSINLTGGPT